MRQLQVGLRSVRVCVYFLWPTKPMSLALLCSVQCECVQLSVALRRFVISPATTCALRDSLCSFIAAAAAATGDVIVFINCDIVVNASFVTGVFAAYSSHPRVLAIGRRTNVDRGGSASVYTRWAIDYFAYSRAAFPVAIPRFAIGRAV